MKIIIADPLPDSAVELLETEGWTVDSRSGRSSQELTQDVVDADALIVRSATKVTRELITAASQLRVIGRAGTGIDNVDVVAASKRGILVLNAPGANSISVAEHTFALILAAARSIALADAQMKTGKWEKKTLRGSELRGKTLGILGLGRIGREVVRRAKAFDMDILTHDPFIATAVADEIGTALVSLEILAERSDFITLHIPLTDNTKEIINANLLARCRRNAWIINTARGDLINETDLAKAITEERIGGAALDVYQEEPTNNTSLISSNRVVATPHIAASTTEAQELVGLEAATAIRDYLQTGVVRNAVNYPSVGPEEFKRIHPYLILAERMGSLLAQLAGSPVDRIGIRYYGALTDGDNEMLVCAAIVGLFRAILSSSISLVNARTVAEQRGLEVIESRSTRARNFTNLVSLKTNTVDGEYWAEGAVFEPGKPRIVRLNDVEVEVALEGTLVVIRNDDQPGVIGEVGSILGRHGINIATLALGRGNASATGVVRIGDKPSSPHTSPPAVSQAVLDEIRSISAVQSVSLVRL